MWSLMTRRVARLAMAPAGAATTVTTTSLLLAGESSSKGASSRVATRSLETVAAATRFGQRRCLSSNSKPGEAAGKVYSSATANVTEIEAEAAASAAKTNKKSFSFLEWYEGHLHARPVVTKMFTGSILWGVGDAVAQLVPRMVAPPETKESTPFAYDIPRTARAVFFGFAIHAPASHVHFNFLEWLTIRTGVTGLYIPLFKAFMEQFVYWSWLSNSLYHGAMGAMQGQTPTQIYHRIADVLWETQKAQWVFWIPIQLLNFRFVPVRHQLNVVLLTSIAWTALLSAWYPPEDKSEQVQEVEEKKEA